MKTLFISDLHLEVEKPALSKAFFDFLEHQARETEALYILGDFFEVWVGDDENLPLHQEVARALTKLSDSGTSVHLMVGNRDFLMGERYANACGATLLPESLVIDLYGQPALILHGDSLCTDDLEYQKFRQMTRNPAWQQQVLSQPLAQRQQTARQLREISRMRNQGKPEVIMDVNEEAVRNAFQENDVTLMIHGHTHRPAVHSHELADDLSAERIVLGDWGQHTHYLCVTPEKRDLIRLDFA